MALPLVAVGAKITAAIANAIINMINSVGGIMIVPTVTSCTPALSAVASTNGLVTFTSSTVISLDTLFTSTYLNHEIDLDYQSDGASATATFVFRTTAPADVTTATYDVTELLGRNATASSSTTAGSNSFLLGSLANKLTKGSLKLANVAVATETTGFFLGGSHADPAVSSIANGVQLRYMTQRDDTAFGGMTITFSSACTGTIRVRGLL